MNYVYLIAARQAHMKQSGNQSWGANRFQNSQIRQFAVINLIRSLSLTRLNFQTHFLSVTGSKQRTHLEQ